MNFTRFNTIIKQVGLSCCLMLPAQSQEFSVGWELWYPYQYHNEVDQLTGVDIEVFNLIAKKAEMSISYVELPWKRHLMYIKSGVIDVAFGASHTKEREETAYFSIPYRKESVNLFVKKGTSQSIKLNQLSDLIGSEYLIGVENGYFYGKEYQRLKTKPDFISRINSVLDIEQNVKMLMKGHIDGFLADPMSMKSFVEKYQFQDEFEVHPLTIYQGDIYIMLSKKTCSNEDLVKVNQAITSLKVSGELQKIIARWSVLN